MPTDDSQWFEELLAAPNAKEAREWLSAEPDKLRTLGELETREESLALVEEAYSAGALRVTAVEIDNYPDMNGAQNTGRLVITLPSDPEQRSAVFRWAGEMAELQGHDPDQEEGQKHLYVGLD